MVQIKAIEKDDLMQAGMVALTVAIEGHGASTTRLLAAKSPNSQYLWRVSRVRIDFIRRWYKVDLKFRRYAIYV